MPDSEFGLFEAYRDCLLLTVILGTFYRIPGLVYVPKEQFLRQNSIFTLGIYHPLLTYLSLPTFWILALYRLTFSVGSWA